MLSRESLDKEGFEDFLLSQTDLKSDGFSDVRSGELEASELAASNRSPSADGSGTNPNCGAGGSEGAGGISGNSICGSGIGGMFIPGGGGGRGVGSPSESVSTSSNGSFTSSLRSSTLFNILWLRN